MLRKRTPARRRLTGLALLIAVVAAAWLGITKPDPFRHNEVVEAMFDHVQGIALVQRDVRVAGVNVGSIGTIRRVGIHAEVELVLHQRIPVYRDARAWLRPHTPFEGTTFIDLDPGTPGAGLLGAAPIPLSQTNVYVSAGDVLNTFTQPVRHSFQVIVAQLSQALGPRGQHGLRAAFANAPSLLRDTAIVAPALRGVDGRQHDELQSLIPGLSSTVSALAGQGDELRSIASNAAATLDAVTAGDAVPLGRSISALPAALTGATAAGRRAVRVVHAAQVTADDLIPALRQIPRTTPELTALLRRSEPVLPAAAPTVDEFATVLAEVGHNGPQFARLLDELGPISRQLADRLVPALDAPTALGLPTYLQLMAATAGLTGVLSSFITQTQVGNAFATGHVLRGTLQTPESLPLGALDIPCSVIATFNARAVPVVEALGLCTT
jgi:ABC-type transporter Mla subunit MlaD